MLRAGLDVGYVEDVVCRALAEDLAGGVDVTSVATVPPGQQGVASFVARGSGVVCGVPLVLAVLDIVGAGNAQVQVLAEDEFSVGSGDTVLQAAGPVRDLLTAERTALNLLCHLSGVATLTRTWVEAVAGTTARIRDTRKTTPGMRLLEKYAVRCGGGLNHRLSLSDAALVKDNHVVAAGGIAAAFTAVRTTFPDLDVEVECDTVEQVREAVEAGAHLVLLDNMSLEQLAESVAACAGRGVKTEASGGLTLESAATVAATGVDFLAIGALTHSAPVLDIGVDLRMA
ncbi:MAG TPA: carboxylating nicotinate-nucleotide diphosphorylase [Mycobacteriales bacterium]|nr:carboxylating nicotinate-nucleotide diphosphorylase [Mycobacteriales bacterium]